MNVLYLRQPQLGRVFALFNRHKAALDSEPLRARVIFELSWLRVYLRDCIALPIVVFVAPYKLSVTLGWVNVNLLM